MVVKATLAKCTGAKGTVEGLNDPDGEYAASHMRDDATIQIARWHIAQQTRRGAFHERRRVGLAGARSSEINVQRIRHPRGSHACKRRLLHISGIAT
jgi:hypothetical protein